ncbi:unnamed protein product [Arabis nemorensis]|uniref:Uncharacterized protein n=1 Tax=Arabis nemorensis TaxID=586526 RepID=A0A565ASK4_9BRAS|nr:unnamed protein product [Arabis nemorensis]
MSTKSNMMSKESDSIDKATEKSKMKPNAVEAKAEFDDEVRVGTEDEGTGEKGDTQREKTPYEMWHEESDPDDVDYVRDDEGNELCSCEKKKLEEDGEGQREENDESEESDEEEEASDGEKEASEGEAAKGEVWEDETIQQIFHGNIFVNQNVHIKKLSTRFAGKKTLKCSLPERVYLREQAFKYFKFIIGAGIFNEVL